MRLYIETIKKRPVTFFVPGVLGLSRLVLNASYRITRSRRILVSADGAQAVIYIAIPFLCSVRRRTPYRGAVVNVDEITAGLRVTARQRCKPAGVGACIRALPMRSTCFF